MGNFSIFSSKRCKDLIDTIKDIGVIFSTCLGAIALLAAIVKPLRVKIMNAIAKTSKVHETEKIITELKSTFNDSFGEIKEDIKELKNESSLNKEANKCMLENRIMMMYDKYKDSEYIDAFEKDTLIAHYALCSQIGSNGKIKFRYEALMNKKSK